MSPGNVTKTLMKLSWAKKAKVPIFNQTSCQLQQEDQRKTLLDLDAARLVKNASADWKLNFQFTEIIKQVFSIMNKRIPNFMVTDFMGHKAVEILYECTYSLTLLECLPWGEDNRGQLSK